MTFGDECKKISAKFKLADKIVKKKEDEKNGATKKQGSVHP